MFTEEDVKKILKAKRNIRREPPGMKRRKQILDFLFAGFEGARSEPEIYTLLPYASIVFRNRLKSIFVCFNDVINSFAFNYPELTSNDLSIGKIQYQDMIDCLLHVNASIFNDLCKYKNILENQWKLFHDENAFFIEPQVLKIKLHSMSDILECQEKLNEANKAIGFLGECSSEFKEYFERLGFTVLNDHRLYLNLGKTYTGIK